MNLTDYIVIVWTLGILWGGWRRGFLRSLVKPILLLICIAVAFLYYWKTKNFLVSLAIATTGPLAAGMIFSLAMSIWNRQVNPKEYTSLVSHVLGAAINLIPGGFFLLSSLFLLTLLPPQVPFFWTVSTNIRSSFSYSLLQNVLPPNFPSGAQLQKSLLTLKDPQKIQSTRSFQDLSSDPKVQDIISDDELIKKIKAGDYLKLINDPKIMAIMNDPELLKKFINFQKEMLKQEPELPPQQIKAPVSSEPGPRVIEIKKNSGAQGHSYNELNVGHTSQVKDK